MPREASSSCTSWADRKSSMPPSAVRTACRWGVGRGPGSTGSVLVIVLPLSGDVDGVAVAVVDVVDVVSVLDREVTAAGPVLVAMAFSGLLVQRERLGVVGHPGAAPALEHHADGSRRHEAAQRDEHDGGTGREVGE